MRPHWQVPVQSAPEPSEHPLDEETPADLSRLRNGSRWLNLSAVAIGFFNYLFALLLTRVLSSGQYSIFAAGQALLLTVGTIATSAVPWVLAHELVQAGKDREARRAAVSFAAALNAAAGLVVGVVTAVIALRFATPAGALAVGLGSVVIFASTNVVGWLQGEERWSLLAVLRSAEVVVKALVGVLLVSSGLGATGGLAGFAVGAGVVVVVGAVVMRRDLSLRLRGLRASSLWRKAGGISLVQGLVAVLSSIDIVVVGSLSAASDAAGSYQATMIVARIPLFLSTAASLAVFTLLARGRNQAVYVSEAVKTYGLLAVPLLVALLTVPHAVLGIAFPPSYDQVGRFLPWLTVSGFSIGTVNLLTTFFQATSRYRVSATAQGVGLTVTVIAIVVGWVTGGLLGVAVGAMAGAVTSAVLLLALGRRTWGRGLRLNPRYALPIGLFGLVLVLLRSHPLVWAVVVFAVGVGCAYLAFVPGRATARPPGCPRVVHLGFEDFRRPGSGGGALRTHEVNSRLADRYDVTVLTTSWPGCRDRVEDGVRYVHIGIGCGYFPSILSYFARLPFVLRRWPADLVVEDFAAPFSSALSPLYTRAPVLAVVQWLNAREKTRQYHLPFHLVENLGLRLHTHYVAVSSAIADEVVAAHPGADVTVVPNGVDPLAFTIPEATSTDVLFVGRLEVAQKGLDLLLQAFALRAADLPGRLLLVGDGQDRSRLIRLVDQRGLSDRVVLLGRMEGRAKFEQIAGAGVVAMCSRYETFGIVAVEALACATPVVAFDIPCLREVVPPRCGLLVAPFDVARFADALVEVMRDPERAQAMGRAGRAFAHQRFEWPAVAEEQAAVYERVLAGSGQLPASTSR